MCLALAINCVLAAHLGNTYIPPPAHAGTAGGSSFLSTPNHGGFASQTASSNHFASTHGHGGSTGASNYGGQQNQHHQQQHASHQSNYQQQSGQNQNQYQHQQHHQQQQQSSGQQIPIIKFENQPNAGDGAFSYA